MPHQCAHWFAMTCKRLVDVCGMYCQGENWEVSAGDGRCRKAGGAVPFAEWLTLRKAWLGWN